MQKAKTIKMSDVKTPPTWEMIRTNLASNDPTQRNVAHWFLQDDADASYLPLLHKLVAEPDEHEAYFSAAAGIARLEGLDHYRALIEKLADRYATAAGEHSAPLDAFVEALQGVSDSHPLPVTTTLTDLLRHERASVRGFAAFLYGGSEAPTPAPLFPLLKDPDPLVRVSAVSAISSFGSDPAVVPALLPLLQDDNEEVRVMSAYVLADLRDPQALAALQQAMKTDSEKNVRQAATHAYRRIRGTDRWLWWGFILLIALAVAVFFQIVMNSNL